MELLSLKWNNHKSTFIHILSILREKQMFTDATLACDGKFYGVHKLVLSTCSEYFTEILDRTDCKNPVIVLKDIRTVDLEALLDYMYLGEVNVRQGDLATLIKAAECLRVNGLAVPDKEPEMPKKTRLRSQSRKTDSSDSPLSKRKRPSDLDDNTDSKFGRKSKSSFTNSSSCPINNETNFRRPDSPNEQSNSRETIESPLHSDPTEQPLHGSIDDDIENGPVQHPIDPDVEPLVKVELHEHDNDDIETYNLNDEVFKEEYDDGGLPVHDDGVEHSNDLPEFLQHDGSASLDNRVYQGHSSFQPGHQPDWPSDVMAYPHLKYNSTDGSTSQQNAAAIRSPPSAAGDREGAYHTAEVVACPQCGKQFRGRNRKRVLKRHSAIHTVIKKHGCPYCPTRTSRLDALKDHITRMHANIMGNHVRVGHEELGDLRVGLEGLGNHGNTIEVGHPRDFGNSSIIGPLQDYRPVLSMD